MIGLALHLGACALDDARAELFENFEEFKAELGWVATFAASAARLGLASRLDPEAARAVGEVAALRAERDGHEELSCVFMRERDDARTLAHEAKLEFSAARETCEQLRGELATARASVQELLAVADRSAIRCSSCSNAAAAVDSTYAYCDEHMPLAGGRLRELSYAAAMRRGRALLPEVTP